MISTLSLRDFFPWVWGFCGDLAPLVLAVAPAEGLATELEPLCISVCEALLALETAWLWVSPTGCALWALPTEKVFWTPSVVSGGSAEFSSAVLGLWVLPTGVEVIVWAPSLEVPWWASSTLEFSRLLSLLPKSSSLCCRDAFSKRSLLMTFLNLAFSSPRVRLRLIKSAWLMATVRAYDMCCSGVEAWAGSVLVVAGVCSTCFRASTSEQFLSAWIWRAAFSVTNLGQSLLEAECEPLQFRHLGLSELGHASLLWPGVAHVWHTSSLALQILELWPNFWHLKHRRGVAT